jgi:hypothetical protein
MPMYVHADPVVEPEPTTQELTTEEMLEKLKAEEEAQGPEYICNNYPRCDD